MACLAGEKLIISMIMEAKGDALECTQVSQLGTKVRVLSTPLPSTSRLHDWLLLAQTRSLTRDAPVAEVLKSGQPAQFHLRSISSTGAVIDAASTGYTVTDSRSVQLSDPNTLVQETTLTVAGGGTVVTTRTYSRVAAPPPAPPVLGGEAPPAASEAV